MYPCYLNLRYIRVATVPSRPSAAHQTENPGETPAQESVRGASPLLDWYIPPLCTGYPAPPGGTNSIDESGHLFQTYLGIAVKEDNTLVQHWEAGAKGIILFVSLDIILCDLYAKSTQMLQTGLFSAAVAALLTVSTQGLQQDPAYISAFYLAKIYQLQANSSGSQVTIPSTLSPPSSDFSPPNYVVVVNSLWFLSLAISITCALSATLVQQWGRRYIKVTQQSYSPQKQARIRAFFAEGMDKFHLPLVVELLPSLLHLSVFLFFAGLGVFLFNLNFKIFIAVIWWLGLCALAYICIIFMPIIRHDSPYHSPLSSSLVWYIWIGVLRIYLRILGWLTGSGNFSYASWERIQHLQDRYREWFQYGIQEAAVESAQKLSYEIDGRALVRTLESFVRDQDPDNKQDDFVRDIPAFCKSRNTLGSFSDEKISEALVGLLHHNLSSKSVNQDRIRICINAIRDASLPITSSILQRVIYKDWGELLGSVDFMDLLMETPYNDPKADYYSKCAIAVHIGRTAQKHGDRWFELIECQLGKSRADLELEGYLTLDDSSSLADRVSFANCIDICHRTIDAYRSENDWAVGAGWRSNCFEVVSNFDPSNTLPELRHEFCRLWNELILIAGDPEDRRMQTLAMLILRHIRKIYIVLHRGTDAAPTAFDAITDDYDNVLFYPSSYPRCTITAHPPPSHEANQATTGSLGGTDHPPSPTFHSAAPPAAPPVPSSSTSYQGNPTRHVPYGTTFSGVPDTSQRTTQVSAPSNPALGRLEIHLPITASPDAAARVITQGASAATDVPATSLMASSDTYFTEAASTPIPLQEFAPPSRGTVEAPGTSPSFPPATVPGHTPPAESGPSSYSSPSRLDPIPSAPAISLASSQANLNVTDADAPTPVEAPHDDSYQTAQSGPEIATDISLGTGPSPRDVDHPQ